MFLNFSYFGPNASTLAGSTTGAGFGASTFAGGVQYASFMDVDFAKVTRGAPSLSLAFIGSLASSVAFMLMDSVVSSSSVLCRRNIRDSRAGFTPDTFLSGKMVGVVMSKFAGLNRSSSLR